jgi:hypothetical protein
VSEVLSEFGGSVAIRVPVGYYTWTTNVTTAYDNVKMYGDSISMPSFIHSDGADPSPTPYAPTFVMNWNPGDEWRGGFFHVDEPNYAWRLEKLHFMNNGESQRGAALHFSNKTGVCSFQNLAIGGAHPSHGFDTGIFANQFYHNDITVLYGKQNGRTLWSTKDFNQTTITHVRAFPNRVNDEDGVGIGMALDGGSTRGVAFSGMHFLGHHGADVGLRLGSAWGVSIQGLQMENWDRSAIVIDGENG